MIPGMAVAFIMMIVAFVLMIPGGAIAMIGARRAPHLDER